MKIFLYRLLIILIPVILYMVTYECLYRSIPNDYSYKHSYLSNVEKASKIEVLVLGTSHTYKGINPNVFKHNVFIGAADSQPLYYDYRILNYFLIERPNLVNLKYVIISCDYATLNTGHNLSTLKESNYYIFWKFNYVNGLKWYEKFKCFDPNLNIERYYLLNYKMKRCDSLGWNCYCLDTVKQSMLKDIAKNIVIKHTFKNIESDRFKNNKQYLKDIAIDCNKRGITLLLLNTPKTNEYISSLYRPQMKSINDYANLLVHKYTNVKYLNWQTCDGFNFNDFIDSDHLNSSGASKLGVKLDSLLFELDIKNQ